MGNLGAYQDIVVKAKDAGGVEMLIESIEKSAALKAMPKAFAVGVGFTAAIGVHVANNVVSLSAGVLRGEDLLGGQADVSASMIELGIQLAFAALICLWVVLLSRRERRGA